MPTTTGFIKSTPLLPATAELAQHSPKKEDLKIDEAKNTISIISDYQFDSGEIIETENYSSAAVFALPTFDLTLTPTHLDIFEETKNNFIGVLSENEAENMKRELILYREKFDNDLARRNKILFGE